MSDQVTVKLSRTDSGPTFALVGNKQALAMLIAIVNDVDATFLKGSEIANIRNDLQRAWNAMTELEG